MITTSLQSDDKVCALKFLAATIEACVDLGRREIAPAERISDEIARCLGEGLEVLAANDGAEDDPFAAYWDRGASPALPVADPVLGSVVRAQWLDTRAAAAKLSFTVGATQTFRWMGTGPAFRKIGRRVVFSAEALAAWREAQQELLIAAA